MIYIERLTTQEQVSDLDTSLRVEPCDQRAIGLIENPVKRH
jgi:hypothetical protein